MAFPPPVKFERRAAPLKEEPRKAVPYEFRMKSMHVNYDD